MLLSVMRLRNQLLYWFSNCSYIEVPHTLSRIRFRRLGGGGRAIHTRLQSRGRLPVVSFGVVDWS